MTIDDGKLVPATAYDAERLDTYRRGTKVNVIMVRDGGRVMERKWFAVLGLVVRQCNVPWKNKDQASEAVKLALGIVNLSKTVGGDFMAYPKSLVELTDPELDEAVRDMMDLIQKMTGIDPATLKKEIADVGEEIEDPSSEIAPPLDGQGSDDTPPPGPVVAADPSEPVGPVEAGAIEAEEEPTAAPASDLITRNLKLECLDKFLALATADGLDIKQRRDNLELVKEPWKQALPTDLEFVKSCLTTADKVAKGELKVDAAKKYLGGLL